MRRVTRRLALDRAKVRRWEVAGAVAMLLFGLQVAGAASSLAATGKTVGSGSVPVYSGPESAHSKTGSVPVGTEDLWDALDSGGYAPDALIYTGSNSAVVPACPSAQFSTGTYPVAWTGRRRAAEVWPIDRSGRGRWDYRGRNAGHRRLRDLRAQTSRCEDLQEGEAN